MHSCMIRSVNILFLYSSPISLMFPSMRLRARILFSSLSSLVCLISPSSSVLSASASSLSPLSNSSWHLFKSNLLNVILSLSSLKSGKAVAKWKQKFAYISQKVGSIKALSNICEMTPVRVATLSILTSLTCSKSFSKFCGVSLLRMPLSCLCFASSSSETLPTTYFLSALCIVCMGVTGEGIRPFCCHLSASEPLRGI
uniref:Uncharacterized protein n=1 Tax=Arundo donax TaxID=35708 RepID=A0A0A9D1D3_ARUDO